MESLWPLESCSSSSSSIIDFSSRQKPATSVIYALFLLSPIYVLSIQCLWDTFKLEYFILDRAKCAHSFTTLQFPGDVRVFRVIRSNHRCSTMTDDLGKKWLSGQNGLIGPWGGGSVRIGPELCLWYAPYFGKLKIIRYFATYKISREKISLSLSPNLALTFSHG